MKATLKRLMPERYMCPEVKYWLSFGTWQNLWDTAPLTEGQGAYIRLGLQLMSPAEYTGFADRVLSVVQLDGMAKALNKAVCTFDLYKQCNTPVKRRKLLAEAVVDAYTVFESCSAFNEPPNGIEPVSWWNYVSKARCVAFLLDGVFCKNPEDLSMALASQLSGTEMTELAGWMRQTYQFVGEELRRR